MNMIKIARGQRYPLPQNAQEGATANFLGDTNILQIGMAHIKRSEERSIRKDIMKAGFIVDGPLILWIFQFGTLIFECPFDVRLIPLDARHIPDVTSDNQRLLVDIHLVDTASHIVKALRGVTLPPQLTRDFLTAVRVQLSDTREMMTILGKYNHIELARLARLANVQPCGDAEGGEGSDRSRASIVAKTSERRNLACLEEAQPECISNRQGFTSPVEIMQYIDREMYELICACAGTEALDDDEAVEMAANGMERLSESEQSGCSDWEKSILATHIQRGFSILGLMDDTLSPQA